MKTIFTRLRAFVDRTLDKLGRKRAAHPPLPQLLFPTPAPTQRRRRVINPAGAKFIRSCFRAKHGYKTSHEESLLWYIGSSYK